MARYTLRRRTYSQSDWIDDMIQKAFSDGYEYAQRERYYSEDEEDDRRERRKKRAIGTLVGAGIGTGTGIALDKLHPENKWMHQAGSLLDSNNTGKDLANFYKNIPGKEKLEMLAAKFGVSPEELLKNENFQKTSVKDIAKKFGGEDIVKHLEENSKKLKRGGIARRAAMIGLPIVGSAALGNALSGRDR